MSNYNDLTKAELVSLIEEREERELTRDEKRMTKAQLVELLEDVSIDTLVPANAAFDDIDEDTDTDTEEAEPTLRINGKPLTDTAARVENLYWECSNCANTNTHELLFCGKCQNSRFVILKNNN